MARAGSGIASAVGAAGPDAGDLVHAAYSRHARAVYASALRILGDAAGAEDAAQDVFLRLCRDPSRFDPARGDLGPYLQLMARSRALDLWRSEQARGRAVERLESQAGPSPAAVDSPVDMAEQRGERSRLLRALGRLPPAQREAVFLAYWADMGVAEIARRSGVPVATAKSRVRLGIEKLAAALAVTPAQG